MAPVFETFRQGLCARQPDGNRAFVRVVELCLVHPVAWVRAAVRAAVACGADQVAAVEHLLAGRLAPPARPAPLDPARYPEYAAVQVAPVAVAPDDQLAPGATARAVAA